MDVSRWESRHRSETSILDWVLWLSGNRSTNQDLKRRFAVAENGSNYRGEVRMRKLVLCTLAGVMMILFVCTPALAQTTGTIRGQMKDADGSPPEGCLFFLLERLLLS
jgi:hypothetical protein